MHASVSPVPPPRVFISYSWDDETHCDWVESLAALLRDKGVDVTLDRWHLHSGMDKTLFMEQSVSKSDFVLVVCTPGYAEKANERIGGVGYEAMMLTSVLASRVLTERFIPVLRSGEWHTATPLWMGTKIGADLRGDPPSAAAFEELLLDLHGARPTAPALGARPVFTPRATAPLILGQRTAHSVRATPLRASIPLELPPEAEAFFGRKAELAKLVDRLRTRKNTAVVADAGFGKTALAAKAVREVTGETLETLAKSPYPDGVLFLDLYTLEGRADRAWDEIARRLTGQPPTGEQSSRDRAQAACEGRRFLLIVEGAEEATGQGGRTTLQELTSVLAEENRSLLLSRNRDHLDPTRIIAIPDTLDAEDGAKLFDSLTEGTVTGRAREDALRLLDGHPLALTWAAKRLLIGDDAPEEFVKEWKAASLPGLTDPEDAKHTLGWLYGRSVRGLPEQAKQALEAAALLGPAPLPVSAIAAGLAVPEPEARELLRLLTRYALLRTAKEGCWQFTHVLGYRFARKETGSDPAMRMRLGEWLHARLAGALAVGAAPAGLTELLEHLGALLRTDEDQSLWQPLVNDALYKNRERLQELGRLGQATLVLDSVDAWFLLLTPEQAEDSFWLRERGTLLEFRGSILAPQGDLDGALRSYRDFLQIAQRLAQADQSSALTSAQVQRDLSVSFDKVGDILKEQGDLDGALHSYRDSLQIRQRLAQADPSSAEASAQVQRDLSISFNKVGDILKEQGDLDGALRSYRDDLQIAQRLAQADPSSAQAQRDLSVSFDNVGNILKEQGDLDGALRSYKDSLQIRQRLVQADPSSAQAQRDLSISFEKVGNILKEQGDLDGALRSHRDDLQIAQRLAQADPSSAQAQRDLSVSFDNVGDILKEQGDLDGALRSYKDSLQIRQRLAQADPSSAQAQRDVFVSLVKLALAYEKQGKPREALPFAEQALRISERLTALDSTNATWRNDLAVVQRQVTRLRAAIDPESRPSPPMAE